MKIKFSEDRLEKMLLKHKWKQHRVFLDIMAPHLEDLTSSLLQEIEAIANQIEDEWQQADYYMYRTDEVEDFHQFNVILTNSFFSYSYFLFESELMDMCRRSKRIHKASCSVWDIRDRPGIEDAKEYMKQLCVAFPSNTTEWDKIKTFEKIRHRIAHRGGDIHDYDCNCDGVEDIIHRAGNPQSECEFLIRYANREDILAGTDNNPRFELTRAFCDKALNTYQRFLIKVLEADPRPTKTSSVCNFTVTQI